MNINRSSHAFILGCERCGSTWLSNVLDAHPDVELFMEPFADYADLFPGFPDRNLYLDHSSDILANTVSNGYDKLAGIKHLLFYNRKKSLYWKKLDKLILYFFSSVAQWKICSSPVRIKQFELLNLNSANTPIKWQTRKNETPSLTVTKELRLNFKIGLLQRVFPHARYIIVVRHPGAQAASIMKLFDRGNLGELRRSLQSLYAHLNTSSRFDKYSNYYKCLSNENDIREMLLLWWLINYETVIEDCKRYNVNHMVAYNDSLSETPDEGFRRIFSFLELDYSQDVEAYITHSTAGSGSRSDTPVISPVNTVRESSRHSRESISGIDDEMRLCVSSLFERFDVIDELSLYRDT